MQPGLAQVGMDSQAPMYHKALSCDPDYRLRVFIVVQPDQVGQAQQRILLVDTVRRGEKKNLTFCVEVEVVEVVHGVECMQ